MIGNPPYVLLQDKFRAADQLAYYHKHYAVASYKVDMYHLFIERGLNLLDRGGLFSMITPANFIANNYLADLRRFILDKASVDHIIVVEGGVFRGASVDNAIAVLSSSGPMTESFPVIRASFEGKEVHEISRTNVSAASAMETELALFTGESLGALNEVWRHLDGRTVLLGEIAHVNFGKQLRDRKTYTKDVITVRSPDKVPHHYKPCYTGRDVRRYSLVWGGLACLDKEEARRGGCWDPERQNAPVKIVTRQIGESPDFALDTCGYQCLNTIFMVNPKTADYSPLLLLGVLNSRLIRNYWLDKFYDQRTTFPKIKGTYLEQLPMPRINTTDRVDKRRYDLMEKLVKTMLRLHEDLIASKAPNEETSLRRQIVATDGQIDRLVYELYGLTDKEIRVVDEAAGAGCVRELP